jgi:hypothetical protein
MRLAVLQDIAVSIARRREVVDFARGLVGARSGDRLARVAAAFTFASHPARRDARAWDGVEALLELAGEDEGPAMILCALLLALGERARVSAACGVAFVQVGLEASDVARLPPHASLLVAGDRVWLPLDARRSRVPLGFLPRAARLSLGTLPSSTPLQQRLRPSARRIA